MKNTDRAMQKRFVAAALTRVRDEGLTRIEVLAPAKGAFDIHACEGETRVAIAVVGIGMDGHTPKPLASYPEMLASPVCGEAASSGRPARIDVIRLEAASDSSAVMRWHRGYSGEAEREAVDFSGHAKVGGHPALGRIADVLDRMGARIEETDWESQAGERIDIVARLQGGGYVFVDVSQGDPAGGHLNRASRERAAFAYIRDSAGEGGAAYFGEFRFDDADITGGEHLLYRPHALRHAI